MGFLAVSMDDETSVAVHRLDLSAEPSVFQVPTRLSFGSDGTISLGDEPAPGEAVVDGFVSAMTRGALDVDGYRVEDLVAHAVNCLAAMVTGLHGGTPPAVVLVHPDVWGRSELSRLREAFAHTGLGGIRLVPVSATSADPSGGPTALAIGGLAIAESSARSDPEAADTDAIPVVAAPRALAFSEAPDATSAFAQTPDEPAARQRRPLVVVTVAAIAVIAASVGIAAALGTFDDGEQVSPPEITDAQVSVTSQPVPTSVPPSAVVPFPTAPANPEPTQDAVAPAPAEVPAPEIAPAPQEPESAAPPSPAAPPPPATRTLPARPTIPDFTYPTIPRFSTPGR